PRRPALEPPPCDFGRVPDLYRPGVAQTAGLEPFAGLELFGQHPRAPHPVEPKRALTVAGSVPGVHVPVGEAPLHRVGLDQVLRGRLLALLEIVELDQAALADSLRQCRDETLFVLADVRLGRLRQIEL